MTNITITFNQEEQDQVKIAMLRLYANNKKIIEWAESQLQAINPEHSQFDTLSKSANNALTDARVMDQIFRKLRTGDKAE